MRLIDAIEEVEKKVITEALEQGDQKQAARSLGITLPMLRQYIAKFNLDPKDGAKTCPLCSQNTDSLIPDTEFDMVALMDAIEKKIVLEALDKCDGNQTAAARLLKMPVHSYRYLLEKHQK